MERLPDDACWIQVFVCTNTRAPGGLPSCGPSDGDEVWATLRRWVTQRRLHTRVYVTRAGCMGWCNADGATVAFYPEGAMYKSVRVEDCETLAARHIQSQLHKFVG